MNKATRPNAQLPGARQLIIAASYLASMSRAPLAEAFQQIDPLLLPLVHSNSAALYQELLHKLLAEQAQPIINAVIKQRLRVSLSACDGRSENQDALEISGDVQASLTNAMRRLRMKRGRAIKSFSSYVAVATHHACNEFLRRKYPERHSLKNKLRYLFERHTDLACWNSPDGEILCGLAEWRFQERTITTEAELRALLCEARGAAGLKAPNRNPHALPLQDLVAELLGKARSPVLFNALVNITSELLEIKEARQQTKVRVEDEEGRSFEEALPDRSSNPVIHLEGRLYLEQLWSEICELPHRQRVALLLNLRDSEGRGVIELLPITGIATMREVAAALEMKAEELAGLWNELPLDDVSIALKLEVTRQQVINLRKSARERLARRMKAQWAFSRSTKSFEPLRA